MFEQTEEGIRACVALAPGNRGGTLHRVDLHDGSVTTVATDSDGERIGTLNDIVFDTTGHYYVVDTSGNICVAGLGPASCITVIGPVATVRTRFVTPVPDPYVTNICFGGPDLRTAYVCSAGRGLLYFRVGRSR